MQFWYKFCRKSFCVWILCLVPHLETGNGRSHLYCLGGVPAIDRNTFLTEAQFCCNSIFLRTPSQQQLPLFFSLGVYYGLSKWYPISNQLFFCEELPPLSPISWFFVRNFHHFVWLDSTSLKVKSTEDGQWTCSVFFFKLNLTPILYKHAH